MSTPFVAHCWATTTSRWVEKETVSCRGSHPRTTVLLVRGNGIFVLLLIAAFMLRGMPLVTAAISDASVVFATARPP
jgi:hypothetical protein